MYEVDFKAMDYYLHIVVHCYSENEVVNFVVEHYDVVIVV